MADAQVQDLDGRAVTIAARPGVTVVRVRVVPALSVARLGKLALLWAGVPVGVLADGALPPGGPAGLAIEAWFWAGAATLAANAAGVVPVRARRHVPLEGDAAEGG